MESKYFTSGYAELEKSISKLFASLSSLTGKNDKALAGLDAERDAFIEKNEAKKTLTLKNFKISSSEISYFIGSALKDARERDKTKDASDYRLMLVKLAISEGQAKEKIRFFNVWQDEVLNNANFFRETNIDFSIIERLGKVKDSDQRNALVDYVSENPITAETARKINPAIDELNDKGITYTIDEIVSLAGNLAKEKPAPSKKHTDGTDTKRVTVENAKQYETFFLSFSAVYNEMTGKALEVKNYTGDDVKAILHSMEVVPA